MVSSFNKKSIIGTIVAICLVFMVGCSSTAKAPTDNSNSVNTVTNAISNNSPSANVEPNTTSTQPSPASNGTKISGKNSSGAVQNANSQKALLQSIKNSASQGKTINCDFAVYGTPIESVESKLGKADREDFVKQAKGTYYTYSKQNVAFGVGKANCIFEVRSFDRRLGQIPFLTVKKFFGNPEYNVTVNGEKIIGYTAWAIGNTREKYKIKIEFVFPKPINGNNDPILKHYSVLFPRGTANDMGNDPGRQW